MSAGKKPGSFYTTHNQIELVRGGACFFQRLTELIEKAEHTIHIRIYIWDDDATGTRIAELLVKAAQRGVSIFAIADGYASQRLSKTFIRRLRSQGVHFRYFEPFFRSSHFYFGRRMHEKLMVVDGTDALVGGINFADRYNDVDGIPAWLDYALHVRGEAAAELYRYCVGCWDAHASTTLPVPKLPETASHCSVRIRKNDWVKGKHEVWRTYFNWFNHSEKSITIMCSYFLPGRVLRHRLSLAAKRGVTVKIILAGPSDVLLAKYAERYLYSWLLKNGIEVYEYQPSILHAKMMVVDNHWVTIGSFNVNNVSAYASMELNLDIRNKPFAWSVSQLMEGIISADCIRVTEKTFINNATWLKRFLQKSAYELIRVILNLTTFYFKHE
jgi:cardiolipin synthase